MKVLVQTSATGLEDDHFSMNAASPFHAASLLRSLYCTEETVDAGPKGVLARMSALMTHVDSQFANENTRFHDSVPESAFDRDRSVRLFDRLAAKHYERGATRSIKNRSRSARKAPAKILQENNNVRNSVVSSPGPSRTKGTTRSLLPVPKDPVGTTKQSTKASLNPRIRRKRRPSVSLKYTATSTTSKETRRRLREQVTQSVRRSRLQRSTEWETQVQDKGYIPDDLTVTSNKIPRTQPAFKTGLIASLELFLAEDCLNSFRTERSLAEI